jgi:nicotinate phosphoribosyltransferase
VRGLFQDCKPYSGLMTDAYQLTMSQAAYNLGKHEQKAVFDVFFRQNPWQGGFAVVAGIRELVGFIDQFAFADDDIDYLQQLPQFNFTEPFLNYLRDFRFSGDIYAFAEGSLVFPNTPILRIHGNITDVRLLETSLLTILNSASLWATKALRLRLAAKEDYLMEFGMRRAQGVAAAYNAAYYGYMGGFDATSNLRAGKSFAIPVSGTQAHNWIQQFPTESEAFTAYLAQFSDNHYLLVDTYDTLKSGVPNAIAAFTRARQQNRLGNHFGIRLDSGDLAYLSKVARRQLDEAGFEEARIIASNDLDEYLIESIKSQGGCIDAWGVGTKFVTCAGNSSFGGVLKLSALVEDEAIIPKIKLSNQPEKITLPGVKQIYRLVDSEQKYGADIIALDNESFDLSTPFTLIDPEHRWRQKTYQPGEYDLQPQLHQIIKNGKAEKLPDLEASRQKVRGELDAMWPEYLRFNNPERYKVNLSTPLSDLRNRLIEKEVETYIQL